MPDQIYGFVQVVDPFPALQAFADSPQGVPAVAFWSPLGGACVMGLSEAEAFFERNLREALHQRSLVDELLRTRERPKTARRILHISDLHFGRSEVSVRKRYLKEHLSKLVPKVDRVIVTGDLLQTPNEQNRAEFDEFRSEVEKMTPQELVLILGNHDVRGTGIKLFGMGEKAAQIADLKWSPLVVDDDLKTVFFCFNSAEKGTIARGEVSEAQRLRRTMDYSELIRKKPAVKYYTKVALVHHHPYNYASTPNTLLKRVIQRSWGVIGKRLIEFRNADDFLKWCASHDIALILHGHKHKPFNCIGKVDLPDNQQHEFLVVGCGSTTGAQRTPMCYDIITLAPRHISSSFFWDEKGDGSGFKRQAVTLQFRP